MRAFIVLLVSQVGKIQKLLIFDLFFLYGPITALAAICLGCAIWQLSVKYMLGEASIQGVFSTNTLSSKRFDAKRHYVIWAKALDGIG